MNVGLGDQSAAADAVDDLDAARTPDSESRNQPPDQPEPMSGEVQRDVDSGREIRARDDREVGSDRDGT